MCGKINLLVTALSLVGSLYEGEEKLEWAAVADFGPSGSEILGPMKRGYAYDLPQPRDAPVYSVNSYTFFGLDLVSSGEALCPL